MMAFPLTPDLDVSFICTWRENIEEIVNNGWFVWSFFGILLSEYLYFKMEKTTYSECLHQICLRLSKQNILCVKLFQAIALNQQWIDEKWNTELLKFTDHAPYESQDIPFELLDNLQKEYSLIFQPNQPFHSGMISLVYKVLQYKKTSQGEVNQVLILKVKRKHIQRKLTYAVRRFHFLRCLITWIPGCQTMGLPFTIDKILHTMEQQLDFPSEVKNTIEMRNKCLHLRYVKIPEIQENVTKMFPDSILMEYIDGKTIQEIEEADYKIYAKQVLKYGFVSSFLGGITHADLHSGNLLFLKTIPFGKGDPVYQIAPIDFGLVVKTDVRVKHIMMEIASELVGGDPESIAIKLMEAFIEPKNLKESIPERQYNQLKDLISNIMREILYKEQSANQMQIYKFFQGWNHILSSSVRGSIPIRINEEFVKIQTAIAMANGISMTLCKNNYMQVTNEVLEELFHVSLFA